ncbi:MAG TPA: DUF192 domain-containing protein [Xanthomonadales bacterium]|nr:DUF192 domain-containing protein [Xanthomonadales bacterium]
MVIIKVKKISGLEKIRGLTGVKKPFAVFFRTRFGIHTFGMKFPIDVLILDQKNRVVKLAVSVKPNRIFLWNPIFNTVIELPAGEVKKHKIKRGQFIKLQYL